MKRIPVVAGLAAVCACGGGQPAHFDLSPFTGAWLGTAHNTSGGAQYAAGVDIVPVDASTVEIKNVCSDGTGAHATAKDASTLVIGSVTCPAEDATCGSVVLSVQDGTATLLPAGLTILLNGTVTGCSQQEPLNFVFYGGKPENSPLTANIFTGSATVNAGQSLQLVGSGKDPLGQPLHYSWSLQKPSTSIATLDNAANQIVNFTADVAGSYTATLIVSADTRVSPPAQITIVAQ